jgi:hypothetical protein
MWKIRVRDTAELSYGGGSPVRGSTLTNAVNLWTAPYTAIEYCITPSTVPPRPQSRWRR